MQLKKVDAMKRKHFLIALFGVMVVEGLALGEAIRTANNLLGLSAVVLGTLFVILMKRRVTDIVEDERTYKVAGKAALLTIRICLYLMAVAGLMMLTISREGAYNFEREGFALAFIACVMMVAYVISYYYYNRKPV